MTEPMGADRSTPILSRPALWAGSALAASCLVGAGYAIGHGDSGVEWREGPAYVGEGQASIGIDDWVYGIAESVSWIDETGSHHGDGWPQCLDVPAGNTVEGLRFATVNVDVDGLGWREVLMVDCRRR